MNLLNAINFTAGYPFDMYVRMFILLSQVLVNFIETLLTKYIKAMIINILNIVVNVVVVLPLHNKYIISRKYIVVHTCFK